MRPFQHSKATKVTGLSILTGFVSLQSRHVIHPSLVPALDGARVSIPTHPRHAGSWFHRTSRRGCVQNSQDAFSKSQDVSFFDNYPNELQAIVRQEASYGLWLDVSSSCGQEARGLLHLSEMDEVTKSMQVGQTLKVRVSHVDVERGQLALSLRSPACASSSSGHVEDASFDDVYACEWLEARVSSGEDSVTLRGVSVDVSHPTLPLTARGFVRADRIDLPGAHIPPAFSAGDQVHVRVLDVQSGMLELSMKGDALDIKADLEAQLQRIQLRQNNARSSTQDTSISDDQDVSAFADMSSEQWMEGAVLHVASYGIYVKVQPPRGGPERWGLVHLAELSEDKTSIQPGDKLNVRMKSVDVVAGRLLLSTRSSGMSTSTGSRDQSRGWIHGVIQEVHKYGLIVQVPDGRGLVYVTEMDVYPEDPEKSFAVGQTVNVRVLDTMERGMLALTMRPLQQQADEQPEPNVPADVEEVPDEQDLQIRELRSRLKDFLGVSPEADLVAEVQGDTPFGTMLSVRHPDGGSANALLTGSSASVRPGDLIRVRIASVDTHRGVLTVTIQA